MEDWHNFGADYDTTLMAWHERFMSSWPEIADNYTERFKRMFSYYLNACAGAFRARDLSYGRWSFPAVLNTVCAFPANRFRPRSDGGFTLRLRLPLRPLCC